MSDIVQKLWGFCHTLRHDGIDYGDYIEQLTYLLFLKMADERDIDLSALTIKTEKGKEIEVDCSWPTLIGKSGTAVTHHYEDILRALGQQRGLLGDIFAGAQSRFNNPVNLKKLLGLIDDENWIALNVDVKAAAFEGLLEKAASEGKKGAGQYFTPRILIQAIVRCMKPDPRSAAEFTICDPACGTGGFLVCSYEWLMDQTKGGALPRDVANRIKSGTYFGQELVARPRRLTLMNLYLHGLEPHIKFGDSIYEVPDGRRFDVVMTNPPFGTKGANQAPTRDDFTVSTSNKQLNFIQHVMTILKPGGRAAVVVPDNCLFADQAGEVFKILTEDCNLHTVLRLPNGTFTPYSPGTKTNVIFFTKGYATETTWIYDGRTNVASLTKKDRKLTPEQFREFEQCYGADPNGKAKRNPKDSKEDRWRSFTIEEIMKRDFKIDALKWLKDESPDDSEIALEPEELATDAIAELQGATEELTRVLTLLEEENVSAAEWKTMQLEEVGKLFCGQSPSVRDVNTNGDGTPYVTGPEQWDGKTIKANKWTTHPKRVVPSGCVFITVKGAGVGTIFPGIDCAIGRDIYAFKPNASVEHAFLYYVLAHTIGEIKRQAQGDIPGLTKDHILKHAIVVPPIEQQRVLVKRIEALFKLANFAENRLARATTRTGKLTQAVLAKAFGGELVPTEAELARREGRNYEPASALLARTRVERESNGTAPREKLPQRKITRTKRRSSSKS